MNAFPARRYGAVIDKIREDLRLLRDAVPAFTSWQGGELTRVCERYSNILIWLAYWDDYRDRCMNLLIALPTIQLSVRASSESGDWRPFNMAAYSLEADLDELLVILD